MKENKTRNLAHGALIAAIYIVLTMVFRPISFASRRHSASCHTSHRLQFPVCLLDA